MFLLKHYIGQHSHHGAALLHDVKHDNAFWGNLKVGTVFALSFLRRHGPLIADFVTTTTMTNPGELKYVAEHVLTMLNEHEVKFVDLRSPIPKVKNSTSLSLLIR